MANFDDDKSPSKLHLLTKAVSQVLRGGSSDKSSDARAASGSPSPAAEKSRTWDPEEWQEDQRYIEAMDMLAAGGRHEPMRKLVLLLEDDPNHEAARLQLFSLALELNEKELLEKHVEWALGRHAQRGESEELCTAYRGTRLALPDFAWSEKALVQAMVAGDKTKNGAVVVDATKLLLNGYPQSAALPRAFMASAAAQAREGRTDLAKVTLRTVMTRFPLDPLAQLAERQLAELG